MIYIPAVKTTTTEDIKYDISALGAKGYGNYQEALNEATLQVAFRSHERQYVTKIRVPVVLKEVQMVEAP